MEDLINLKEYAQQYHISWHTCKKWIEQGLKHIGTRPYKTKKVWIDEFLENYSEADSTPKARVSINKPRHSMSSRKFDINDYV